MPDNLTKRIAMTIARQIDGSSAEWSTYLDDARAVLTEMRQPAVEMIDAELRRRIDIMISIGSPVDSRDHAMIRKQLVAQWQTMIDAALAE